MRRRNGRRLAGNNDDEDNERRRGLVGFPTCQCVFGGALSLVVILIVVLIVVLLHPPSVNDFSLSISTTSSSSISSSGATSTTETPTTTPASPNFVCPRLEYTNFGIDPSLYSGFASCVDDFGDLYYFHGESGPNQVMAVLNVSDPLNVVSGPNLLTGGSMPLGIGVVTGCVWNPITETFYVIDWSCSNLYSVERDGQSATLVGSNLPSCHRSPMFLPDGRLFVTEASSVIYQIDPLTSDELAQIEVTGDTSLSSLIINAIALDPATNQTYAAYRHRGFDDIFITTFTSIGLLNLEAARIEASCIQEEDHLVRGLSFTPYDRRIYMTSGRRDLYKLYTLEYAPFPDNITPSTTFSLECSADYVGDITQAVPANVVIINGTACDLSSSITLLDATDLAGGVQPTNKKRDISSDLHPSVAMPVQTMVPVNCINATEVMYNVSVVVMEDDISTHTRNKRTPLTSPFAFLTEDTRPLFSDRWSMYHDGTSDGTRMYNLIGAPTLNDVSIVTQPTSLLVQVNLGAPMDCQVVGDQRMIFYDDEADRIVVVWVTGSLDMVCVAASTSASFSGTYDFFAFDFTGEIIDRFEFAVWGDYYTACWNSLAQPVGPVRDAYCHVFERDRILNGGGTPRVVTLPRHQIVDTSGNRATASVHHQPHNNGPRGPMATASPCGIFSAMTANGGGILNLLHCQAVDFGAGMATILQTLTTVGPYNDGTTGTCPSLEECIPVGAATQMDPHRYELVQTYRHFPSESGRERVVYAIVTDADGSSYSRIRMASFTHNSSDGTLITDLPLQVVNLTVRDSFERERHYFAPALALNPNGYLFMNAMATWTDHTGSTITGVKTAATFTFGTNDFNFYEMFPNLAPDDQGVPYEFVSSKRFAESIKDSHSEFYCSGFHRTTTSGTYRTQQFDILIRIRNQRVTQKTIGIDSCNATAACYRDIQLTVPTPTLPN